MSRSGQPELMRVHVRPRSTLSKTLVEAAPVTRMRAGASSNSMLTTLDKRSPFIFFQDSPASELRNTPSWAASQMFPLASTETPFTEKSVWRCVVGSQFSPPSAEIASVFLLATTTIRSATARLKAPVNPGTSSLLHVNPESGLTSRSEDVTANHL